MPTLKISSVEDLGLLLKASRKVRKIRQDQLASQVNVGHVFIRDVEHGKSTVQMGRALRVLAAAGLQLQVTVSDEVLAVRARLAQRQVEKAGSEPALVGT